MLARAIVRVTAWLRRLFLEELNVDIGSRVDNIKLKFR